MATKETKQKETQQNNGADLAYKFSDVQQESVNAIFSDIEKLNSNLQCLLNHVIREVKLPQVDGGYALNRERTGLIPRSALPEQ